MSKKRSSWCLNIRYRIYVLCIYAKIWCLNTDIRAIFPTRGFQAQIPPAQTQPMQQQKQKALKAPSCPRWTDPDIRHLIAAWAEIYPEIGKQRNSREWETIAQTE